LVVVHLRAVEPGDIDIYVRLRYDPEVMKDLGGAQPREGMEARLLRDIGAMAADQAWFYMIVPDAQAPGVVAGTVTLFEHQDDGLADSFSEIGWAVLPQFQWRGIGKAAVRACLEQAARTERWGAVHAFPSGTNAGGCPEFRGTSVAAR
jgi:RimJ/RimL family protein N-acetyltransferase